MLHIPLSAPRVLARRASVSSCIFAAALLAAPSFAAAQVSVLTQHNDNLRDGLNAQETVLTPANVGGGQFGLLFKMPVDDQVYAQPLIANGVNIDGGTHGVLYAATTNNSIYAFDAKTGQQYWTVNLGTAFTIGDGGYSCDDILDTSGIMSTPVIDTANNTLYVVAETYVNGVAAHKLHALNLSTGKEQSGSPVQIQGGGFISTDENQRPGLLLANGNIYISFAAHCDQGSWKGFTFAYNAGTLAQVGVFNPSPSDNGNGVWQSGNGPAADPAGNVYWVTGNGAWDGESNFSETVLKASPTLSLEDWYTPSDYQSLDSGDTDLSASGPLLMPGLDRLVAGGKDGILRLVNTDNMGHLGDANVLQTWTASSSHIHSLTYFASNLYIWGQSDYLKVFHFNGTTFGTTPTYTGSIQAIGHPGATLSISANGTAGGILWASTNSQGQGGGLGAWHMTEPGILYAYSLPGMTPLWNSLQNAARDSCANYAKFTPPTIANGIVYLASFGTAQTRSGQICAYGELPQGTNLLNNGTYLITSVHSGDAIDDPGSSTKNGTIMEQWGVNNGANQHWVVNNLGNNVITLTNAASGQALDVSGGSKANSALVVQWPYHDVTWEQWTVSSAGNNAFVLTNVSSGQVLDVDGGNGGTQQGKQLDQYPYQSNPWQQWIFTAK